MVRIRRIEVAAGGLEIRRVALSDRMDMYPMAAWRQLFYFHGNLHSASTHRGYSRRANLRTLGVQDVRMRGLRCGIGGRNREANEKKRGNYEEVASAH
jgi:hypothetical protein